MAALLTAFAAQCLLGMRVKSVTFDEPTYVAAGYVALTTGVDINPAHPPLVKYLLALPVALLGSTPAPAIPHWDEAKERPLAYGDAFLFDNRVDADTLLFAARSMIVALAVGLGILVWAWARRLYGPEAGLVALGAFAFSPNLLAHASLATLDLPLTAGVTAASYATWRALERPTRGAAVVAGIALGLALLIKATALLLLAVLPIEVGAAIARHRRDGRVTSPTSGGTRARRAATPPPPTPVPALVATTALMLAVAAAVVCLAYGPRQFGLATYAASVAQGVFNREAFMNRHYQAFCWGRYSPNAFWWYFLAAFVLKTPIPTLVASVATMGWLAITWRRVERRFAELFLVLPVTAFFVATAFSTDDLGLRYVLPVYPLLYVLIGGTTVALTRWIYARTSHRWQRAAAHTALATVALAYVGGTLAIFPDYLAFFNGLVCGPGDGIRYLDDSNIDWGQDFKQLAVYVHEHRIAPLTLLYNPLRLAPRLGRYYGVTYRMPSFDDIRHPKPGWFAVSAHLLQRPYLSNDPANLDLRFDWLDRYTPVAKIGYSIYLYHFD